MWICQNLNPCWNVVTLTREFYIYSDFIILFWICPTVTESSTKIYKVLFTFEVRREWRRWWRRRKNTFSSWKRDVNQVWMCKNKSLTFVSWRFDSASLSVVFFFFFKCQLSAADSRTPPTLRGCACACACRCVAVCQRSAHLRGWCWGSKLWQLFSEDEKRRIKGWSSRRSAERLTD